MEEYNIKTKYTINNFHSFLYFIIAYLSTIQKTSFLIFWPSVKWFSLD